MVFEAPPTQRHEVQLLTTGFQFTGQLETVGNALNFINDPAHDSLSLYDVHLTPLTPGSPLQGLHRPMVVARRPQIVLIYFVLAETRESIRLLTRKELLVAYTPIAVCRGYFHVTAETRMQDFIDAVPGYFVPVTGAQVFPLIEFPAPFPLKPDLLMLGRSQIQTYHPA